MRRTQRMPCLSLDDLRCSDPVIKAPPYLRRIPSGRVGVKTFVGIKTPKVGKPLEADEECP